METGVRTVLKVKRGVTPKILVIAAAAINAATLLGAKWDVVITSGNDGKHMKGSKHYSNNALDLRTWNIPNRDLPLFVKALAERLGPDYDVVLEDDHIHVEFDPPAVV